MDKAVSNIMGVLLMLGLLIVLVAVLGVAVFGFGVGLDEDTKASDSSFRFDTSSNTIIPVTVDEGKKYEVKVNGNTVREITGANTVKLNGVKKGDTVTILDPESKKTVQTFTVKKKSKAFTSEPHKTAPDCKNVTYEKDKDGYYLVTNDYELQCISSSGKYRLANNIDASLTGNWNDGNGFKPISNFNGEFDGNNKKIIGLTINRSKKWRVGLFGISYGDLYDLKLVNVDITGDRETGGLVGSAQAGSSVENIEITGKVNGGDRTGGVAGSLNGLGSMLVNRADVNGNEETGGLVGRITYNTKLTNSYNKGSVNGGFVYGGLVGYNYGGVIRNSYNVGSVTGGRFGGGLLGSGNDYIIESSYWNKDTTGLSKAVGTEGKVSGSALTTSEMQGKNAKDNMPELFPTFKVQEDNYPTLKTD